MSLAKHESLAILLLTNILSSITVRSDILALLVASRICLIDNKNVLCKSFYVGNAGFGATTKQKTFAFILQFDLN